MALRLATRGSALALAQARQVAGMLGGAELVVVRQRRRARRQVALRPRRRAGAARGSTPTSACTPPRTSPPRCRRSWRSPGCRCASGPADAWVGGAASLDEVADGARVGTASLRPRSQLLALRPDLRVVELHGNVDTRLGRLAEGDLDAIVLACAGLRRLGREAEISFELSAAQMTPAAGQGALVLQARRGEEEPKVRLRSGSATRPRWSS